MQQLADFVVNHWMLVTAFCAVLGLLLATIVRGAGGLAPQEAVGLMNRDGAVAIDVRPREEYDAGHIIDALHLPMAELAQAGERLARHRERPLVVYCNRGAQSQQAVRELARQGFTRAQSLNGGLNAWRAENLPLAGR